MTKITRSYSLELQQIIQDLFHMNKRQAHMRFIIKGMKRASRQQLTRFLSHQNRRVDIRLTMPYCDVFPIHVR